MHIEIKMLNIYKPINLITDACSNGHRLNRLPWHQGRKGCTYNTAFLLCLLQEGPLWAILDWIHQQVVSPITVAQIKFYFVNSISANKNLHNFFSYSNYFRVTILNWFQLQKTVPASLFHTQKVLYGFNHTEKDTVIPPSPTGTQINKI